MRRSQISNLRSQIPWGVLAWLCVASMAWGAAGPNEPAGQVVVVVVGAEGEPQYGAQFAQSADLWQTACAKARARFVGIGLDPGEAVADRTRLQEVLAAEAADTARPLWLVLIGHGTYDGRTARFNLRGPDVSAQDLAEWLGPLTRPVAVINTSPSSSPFLKALSGPGRVVMTATKSGFEQSATRFGQALAAAVADPGADLDKDGQTSLLEAFLTASSRVREGYAAEGRLLTEHALVDDNGDGLGTPADWFRGIRPVQKAGDGASLDGYRAHQVHLVYSPAETRWPPDLRARRDGLELEVMRLRDIKQTLSEEAYYTRLEALLVEMARIYVQ